MFNTIAKTALALACIGAALVSASVESAATQIVYASVGPDTSVPYGWLDFCERYQGECQNDTREAVDIEFTHAALAKIQRVNAYVNGSITPVSDMDHWGVVDQWDIPTDGKGDCEDYALLKRKMLMEEGFPRQALLMTVVKDANGDGHAVLTVKTTKGEYILDNMNDAARLWTATPYRYVKRQAQTNQNEWVALGAPTSAPLYVSK
jgi:predicted transglutaminase-like cysteine proteinase